MWTEKQNMYFQISRSHPWCCIFWFCFLLYFSGLPFLTYIGTFFQRTEHLCVRKICRNSKGSSSSANESGCIGLGTQNWSPGLQIWLCFAQVTQWPEGPRLEGNLELLIPVKSWNSLIKIYRQNNYLWHLRFPFCCCHTLQYLPSTWRWSFLTTEYTRA